MSSKRRFSFRSLFTPKRRVERTQRWRQRFPRFTFSEWRSRSIVESVCGWFRASAAVDQAVRRATGSQLVGACYGRQLGVEGLEERQMLSAAPLGVGAYTQDFDTLAISGTSSVVPSGWAFSEAGTNADSTYGSNSGNSTTGDTYSYGSALSTDRAFGGLQSGPLIPTIGAEFSNMTGGTITSLQVSYTGEQWRSGANANPRADRLDFQYSTNATGLNTGTWFNVDALDFTSPITAASGNALDGNLTANRTAISASISSLSLPDGASIWFRWTDLNAAGADDGLAIDDVSITPTVAAGEVTVNGGAGADTLVIDFDAGTYSLNGDGPTPIGANTVINFEGGDGSDTLVVTGDGQSATYTPATTGGAGSVVVGGVTINFTGLEPVDISGMASVTVMSPANAANALALDAGFDSATGLIPAIVVSGNTGLGMTQIESAHLWSNGGVIIDTTATTSGGANTITINSAISTAHGNGTITLNTNGDGEVIFDADLLSTGAITINTAKVTLNADVTTAGKTANTAEFDVNSPGVINDAIALATTGDTINVGAGTYAENLVLTKELTLLGAQAGVDARGRVVGAPNPAVETVLAPAAGVAVDLQTGSNATTIDGFAIVGSVSGATGVILSSSGVNDGLTLQNNHVAVASGFTASALFLNRSANDADMDQNVFVAASGSTQAVFLDGPDSFDGLHFTNNNVLRDGGVGGTGFFVDGAARGNVGTSASLRTPLLQGNLFQGHALGLNGGSRSFQNALITENTFDGNSGGMAAGPLTSSIEGNTFSNNSLYGLRLTSFGNTVDPVRGAQSTTVTENTFTNNGFGVGGFGDVRVDDQFNGTQSTNTISGNSLGSTVGLANVETNAELINASGNWWGTALNPFTAGKIGGAAAANVDYTPWLNTATDMGGDPSDGFQGDFSDITVDDDSPQSGVVGRINEGIGVVTAGGTVHILAGTYAESVDATSDSVVLAPGASPAQVTVSDLTLDGDDTFAVEIDGLSAATQFDNFIVTGTATPGGAALTVAGSFVPAIGNTFTIIDAATLVGAFSTTSASLNSVPLNVTYPGGGDVVLAVPPPATVWVDDDWVEIVNGGGTPGVVDAGDVVDSEPDTDLAEADTLVTGKVFGYDAYATIPNAIAGVAVGGVINVLAGGYAGTVNVNKNVTISGQGAAVVTISSGGSAVVSIADDKTVLIDNVTILSGSSVGMGVSVQGMLELTDSVVDSSLAGGSLIGVNVDGSGSFEGDLTMSGTVVRDFSLFAVNVGGANATAAIDHSEFNGVSLLIGPTALVHASEGSTEITNSKFVPNALSNTRGVLATSDAEVSVYYSSFAFNNGFAVTNATTSNDVDASSNWWDTNSEAGVLARTEGDVDITPFLNVGTNSAAVGFDGDFSHLHVTALGVQTGATGRIQEGVNEVDVNGIVQVHSGTYTELTNVNKTVSLRGEQFGVDARTRAAVPETIVNGAGGSFSLQADSVELDGFTIEGTTGLPLGTAIHAQSGFSGYQISNNIIQDNPIGLYLGSSGAFQTVVEQNLIRDNNNPGAAGGTGIYSDQGLSNALIQDNRFAGDNFTAGMNLIGAVGPVTNVTVSTNDFEDGNQLVLFNVDNSLVDANTFTGTTLNGTAIFAGGGNDDLTISGNIITNRSGNGISVTDGGFGFGSNSDATIIGNIITQDMSLLSSTAPGSTRTMINVSQTTGNSSVDSNMITLTGATFGTNIAAVRGISISGAATQNVDVIDNTLDGSNGGAVATVGVLVQSSATSAVVTLEDNAVSDFVTGVHVAGGELDVEADNVISGGTTGLLFAGPSVDLTDLDLEDLEINGASGDYITLSSGAFDDLDLNGTGLTLDGVLASTMTPAQLAAAENKITHELDDNTLGLVVLVANTIFVSPAPVDSPTDNDYLRIKNAVEAAGDGWSIILTGTFDWTQMNAAASWALGNDGVASTADDYTITVPVDLNGVTFTSSGGLGSAEIQGPGDLMGVNLEGVLIFDGGDNQGWTISDLRFLDFDLSIGFFNGAGGSDAFNNTTITNNYIRVPADLNTTAAPADPNQNIGIHYSFGTNQTISNNTIELVGNGVSDGTTSFSSSVGMQSNTSGSNVYDGLVIDNNTINVTGALAASQATFLGIWENAHAHSSEITVSNNDFFNLTGNNSATNLMRAFRVTSHSSSSTTVAYTGNTADGANIGFQWLAGSNFAGNEAVELTGNTLTNVHTGVLVQSNGVALLSDNSLTGNGAAFSIGVDVTAGSIVTIDDSVGDNDITGFDTGIRSAGTLTVEGNDNSINNNASVGIDVTGGMATITGNNIHDNGIGVRLSNATGDLTDNDIHDNYVGIDIRGASTLTLTGGTVDDNESNGLLVIGDGSVQSITVDGTSFSSNSTGKPVSAGHGDITLFDFGGPAGVAQPPSTASFTDVTINSDMPDYAIQVRGRNGVFPFASNVGSTATVSFDNVDILGTQQRFGMLIQQYANLSGFSFNDVTFDSVALGGLVIFDAAGLLDLGDTTFHDNYTAGDGAGNGTGIDIATSLNNIDATDVTFLDSSDIALDKTDLQNNFAIEDRVGHAVDAPTPAGTAFVDWVGAGTFADAVFLTTESYFPGPPVLSLAPSVQRAVDVADGAVNEDTLYIQAGDYVQNSQLLIDNSVRVIGDPTAKPVITPGQNFSGVNAADAWILVNSGVTFDLSRVVLDGDGFFVWQGLRSHGNTSVDDVDFLDIKGSASGSPYRGFAILSFGGTVGGGGGSDSHGGGGAASHLEVTNSTFADIGRVGVLVKGTMATADVSDIVYTGKGVGDWLDYGIEVGAGAKVDIVDVTISGNRGVASDGSTSAGVLVTTFFGAGSEAHFSGANLISGNTDGVVIGFNSSDSSDVTVSGGQFINNDDNGISILGGSAASLLVQGATVTGNDDAGIRAEGPDGALDGPQVLIENTNFTGNGDGIHVSGNAIVDAGLGGNTTLVGTGPAGASAGFNTLTGYTGVGGNYAIEDLNFDAGTNRDVQANNNAFGSAIPAVVEQVVFHTEDDPQYTRVFFNDLIDPPNTPFPPLVVFVDDSWAGTAIGADADGPGGGTLGNGQAFGYDQFATIQDAIDAVAVGGEIRVYAGTYTQAIVIDQSLDLFSEDDILGGTAGDASADSVIDPSAVVTNVVTITSSGVEIAGFTVEGDGADSKGILATHATATLTGLVIRDNAVRNLLRRGIQSDTYLAEFDIHGNAVSNITGDPDAIAIFNYGGGGMPGTAEIHDNVITGSTVGIGGQQSAGMQVYGNQITMISGSVGILDSNPGTGSPPPAGATEDITDNVITGGDATSYGVLVFNTAMDVLVQDNNVSTPGIGLAAHGSFLPSTVTFDSNEVDAGFIGILVSTDLLGFGDADVDAVITNDNDITGGGTGILVEETGAATATVTISNNSASIHGNAIGIDVNGGTVDISGNHIYDNGIGIQFRNGGTTGAGSVANNDFNDDTLGDADDDNDIDISIQGSAGAVTIGNGNDYAGDLYYIENLDGQDLDLTAHGAATYESFVAGGAIADDFRIEDHMFHGPDNGTSGVVYWVLGNLFVSTPGTFAPQSDETIQNAVDVADPGNIVNIEDGTYVEQVEVDKNLTLRGQSQAGAIIQAPAALTLVNSFSYGGLTRQSVVAITGGTVTVEDLTVDGAGAGGTVVPGNDFHGIGIHNANANIDSVTVTGVRDNPLNGIQRGRAIFAGNDTGTHTVTVTGSTVQDYQKNGVDLRGAGLSGVITNNTITGAGPTGLIAQNGIVILGGATANISGNTITDHEYTGVGASSTGILLFTAGAGTTVSNNLNIDDNQIGIAVDSSTLQAIITGNEITGSSEAGIRVNGGSAKLQGNTVRGSDGNQVGIKVMGGAIVDAGSNLGDGDPTGLGASTGGNILTGYTGTGGNYAIEDLNLAAQSDVFARFNDFGPYVDESIIETYVFDDTDDPTRSMVLFSPANNQQAAANVVFVDDNWAGTPLGNDADGAGAVNANWASTLPGGLANGTQFGVDQFATIQDAINAVAAGGRIYVWDGTYVQELIVDQALTLYGVQAGVDARGRVATESVIDASGSGAAMIEITVSSVTIDGFEIDGSGYTRAIRVNGVDSAVIRNNIISGSERGVQYNGAAAGNTGGVVSQNQIENLVGVETYGVLAFDSSYVSVTDNDMTGLDVGIFEQYFYQPNGGLNPDNVISGNDVTADLLGYGTNERGAGAATTALSGNVYTIGTGGTGVQLYNIYKAGGITLNNETIDISGAGVGVYAYINGGSVSMANSSISGDDTAGSIGVHATNYLAAFSQYATSFSSVASAMTISGSDISDVETGVLVEDAFGDFAPADTIDDATGSVTVTIDSDTDITSTNTGVKVSGPAAAAIITGNDNSISGNTVGIDVDGGSASITGNHIYDNGDGIVFRNGGTGFVTDNNFDGPADDNVVDISIEATAGTVTIGDGNDYAGDNYYIENLDSQDLDLTAHTLATYEGNVSGSFPGNFRIEDKMFHGPDNGTSGVISLVADTLFVTTPGTGASDETIQNAINVADQGGDTVFIEAGTFSENLTIGKDINLIGELGLTTLQTVGVGNAITIDGAGFGDDETVSIDNIDFDGLTTGSYGIRVNSTADFDRLAVSDGDFTSFQFNGTAVFGNATTGLSVLDVDFINLTFSNNGLNGGGGTGDVQFFEYNGDATLTNLDLVGSATASTGARLGIQFRGTGDAAGVGVQPMGVVTLNDIDVSGDYRTQMIGIQRYSDVDDLTFTDVALGGASSEITGTFGASLRFDAVGFGSVGTPETVDLGNTLFRGLAPASAQPHEIEFAPDNSHTFLRANGLNTQWVVTSGTVLASALTLAEAYEVEDRILHYVDKLNPTHGLTFGPYKGFVDVQADKAFITDRVNAGLLGDGSIQRGVNIVGAGDTVHVEAGTFTESVNVNKHVRIIGAGSGNTILTQPVTPDIFQITASGASNADPLLLEGMTLTPTGTGTHGILITGTMMSPTFVEHLKLSDITVTGSSPMGPAITEIGFRIMDFADVDDLVIENSLFQNLNHGMLTEKHLDITGTTNVTNVLITDTQFNNNQSKGFYAEKLSDATFTNVVATGNGNLPFFVSGAGIEINLKGSVPTYQNLTFNNLTVTNNGLGTPTVGVPLGAGLQIKARGTGDTGGGGLYAANPATLNNVDIIGGTFTGNRTGIRIGEPGQLNTSPTDVVIDGVSVSDSTEVGINIVGGVATVENSTLTNNPTGILVNGAGRAIIIDNPATITGGNVGIDVSGGTALVQNTSVNGNTIGVRIQNGGIADLGQAGAPSLPSPGNYTGLGVSTGGNNFSSYAAAATSTSGAIVNLNTGGAYSLAGPQGYAGPQKDVAAFGNIWNNGTSSGIENVVWHDVDDTNVGFVDFGGTFRVIAFQQTVSGFTATFNRPPDLDDLNLYDLNDAPVEAADVTLTGLLSGNIVGSISWDASTNTLSFVKTGSPLANDTYTVTLFSSATAFHDQFGNKLDGDSDNNDLESPDNYTNVFVVTANAPGTRIVSVRDFARGPGQDVDDAPETANSQLGVRINDATNVRSLDFTFTYDPALLQINGGPAGGASLAPGIPGDWSLTVNNATPGTLIVSASGLTALSGSNVAVIVIDATIPAGALYGDSQVLELTSTDVGVEFAGPVVLSVPSLGDFAVHKNTYLGDVDGSGTYLAFDSSLIQQYAVSVIPNKGFDAHDWTDPVIVGDVNRSGTVTGADASIVLQRAANLPTPQIPTPIIPVTHLATGADPQLSIASQIPAPAGGSVIVPVTITIEPNTDVFSSTFTVTYDPAVVNFTSASLAGTPFASWSMFFGDDEAGLVTVAMSSGTAYETGAMAEALTLINLTFSVAGAAPNGTESALDIEPVDENEGGLMWTDADGSVLIDAAAPRVESVIWDSTAWSPSFRDYMDGALDDGNARGYLVPNGAGQLATLPWVNIDRLKIKFNQDVGASLSASDFSLVAAAGFVSFNSNGSPGALPTITGLSYDNSTFTATLTLSQALQSKAFDIVIDDAGVTDLAGNPLDGEWVNGVTVGNSGNGTAGGDFSFRQFSLPGDARDDFGMTGNRIVNSGDAQDVRDFQNGFVVTGLGAFSYNPRTDLDGNATTQALDAQSTRDAQNAFIAATPIVAAMSASGVSGLAAPPLPLYFAQAADTVASESPTLAFGGLTGLVDDELPAELKKGSAVQRPLAETDGAFEQLWDEADWEIDAPSRRVTDGVDGLSSVDQGTEESVDEVFDALEEEWSLCGVGRNS
jgi:hypothetical protein